MATNKVTVRVLTARGHGPNSLFPHEESWCELWVNNESTKVETSKQRAVQDRPMWDEVCELPLGHGAAANTEATEIHIRMRGKLPSRDGIDEIGFGVCCFDGTSPPTGKVSVPIATSIGKEAGEIDLEFT